MRNIIESKYLASMMASENIKLKFDAEAKTASFSVENRVLTMPTFAGIDQHLFDMLITHEIGHALYSPSFPEGISTAQRDYINILEDVRVDRLQRERFAGVKKDYYFGAEIEINEKLYGDLTDIDNFCLIDRINLHSKIGMHKRIPFSGAELAFLKKAYATKTFEDVVTLAHEIMEYERNKEKEEEQEQETSIETSISSSQSEGLESSSLQSSNSKEEMEEENKDTATKSSGESNDEEETKSSEGDNDSKEHIIKDNEDNVPSPLTANALKEYITKYILNDKQKDDERVLDYTKYHQFFADGKAFRDNMMELFRNDKITSYTDYDYGIIKWEEKVKKDLNEIKSAISVLVRQWQMKRKAKSTVSLATNKGDIDVNKLAQYKITDDIFFTRIQETVNNQNHKIVMLLDCSGSMNNGGFQIIADKIAILRGFCKAVNVPFEIVGFSSYTRAAENMPYADLLASREITADITKQDVINRNRENKTKDNLFPNNGLCLLDILNSTDGDDYFNRLYYSLRYATFMLTFCRWWRNDTPLNYAVGMMYGYLKAMKVANPEQKLDYIVLTDGESSDFLDVDYVLHLDRMDYTVFSYQEDGSRLFDYQYAIYKALKESGIVNSVVKYHVIYSIQNMRINRDIFLLSLKDVEVLESALKNKYYCLYNPKGKLKGSIDKVYFLYCKTINVIEPYRVDQCDLSKKYINKVKDNFMATLNKSAINRTIAGDIVDFLV